MNNIVIFGDSQYAEKIYRYIMFEGEINVLAFTNQEEFISRNEILNKPVIPFEKLREELKGENFKILVVCGYSKMNKLREKICNLCIKNQYELGRYISKNALIYTDLENIENNVIIFPNTFIGPNVRIGIGTIVSASVSVSHDNVIGKYSFFSTGVVVGGFSNIENYSFVGIHSTIKNDINVSEGTFIGASTNLLYNTEPYGIYIGNPARKLEGRKSTDIDHI